MRLSQLTAGAAAALALVLTACTGPSEGRLAPSTAPSASASPGTSATSSATAPGASHPGGEQSVVGTVIRFTAGADTVDVTINEDSPATRDFLSMLPVTLTLEEFNGREKIAYLPRKLHHQGSPGSDPEDGDLIYYIPWGNIGFYYNTAGIDYSDQTLHLGTYNATPEELARFEGEQTTVEVVNR